MLCENLSAVASASVFVVVGEHRKRRISTFFTEKNRAFWVTEKKSPNTWGKAPNSLPFIRCFPFFHPTPNNPVLFSVFSGFLLANCIRTLALSICPNQTVCVVFLGRFGSGAPFFEELCLPGAIWLHRFFFMNRRMPPKSGF